MASSHENGEEKAHRRHFWREFSRLWRVMEKGYGVGAIKKVESGITDKLSMLGCMVAP